MITCLWWVEGQWVSYRQNLMSCILSTYGLSLELWVMSWSAFVGCCCNLCWVLSAADVCGGVNLLDLLCQALRFWVRV
jgi:hypothetical protein